MNTCNKCNHVLSGWKCGHPQAVRGNNHVDCSRMRERECWRGKLFVPKEVTDKEDTK